MVGDIGATPAGVSIPRGHVTRGCLSAITQNQPLMITSKPATFRRQGFPCYRLDLNTSGLEATHGKHSRSGETACNHRFGPIGAVSAADRRAAGDRSEHRQAVHRS